MLIEFTVGNFRSIKEPATLSMAAAKLSSRPPEVDQNNTIAVDDDLTLLTSAAVYGANASGKSNLIKALSFMRTFVMNSSIAMQAGDPIGVVPFRLSTETEDAPSFFELVFALDRVVYRYGFEVTAQEVVSEWLFYAPKRKEARLFVRQGQDFQVARGFKGGSMAKSITRPNALYLSVAAQFNSETAIPIVGWFRLLTIISGLDDDSYHDVTAARFGESEIFRQEVLRLIRASDVNIEDMQIERTPRPEVRLPSGTRYEIRELLRHIADDEVVNIKLKHTQWGSDGRPLAPLVFDLEDESEGTQRLVLISGPVIDALINGAVLVIDEIEGRLHTLLTQRLVQLFNSPVRNPKHAQLIFATHDTNLLSRKTFRRDQIWFMEKDRQGASHLYSLAELKIRNDASFESDYLEGRYGGIPLLGELRQIVIDDAQG